MPAIVSTPPYAVVLLGDVGQIKELPKRLGHEHEVFAVEFLDQLHQTCAGIGVAASRQLRDFSNLRHHVEHRLALKGNNGIAEHVAQHANVLT